MTTIKTSSEYIKELAQKWSERNNTECMTHMQYIICECDLDNKQWIPLDEMKGLMGKVDEVFENLAYEIRKGNKLNTSKIRREKESIKQEFEKLIQNESVLNPTREPRGIGGR